MSNTKRSFSHLLNHIRKTTINFSTNASLFAARLSTIPLPGELLQVLTSKQHDDTPFESTKSF